LNEAAVMIRLYADVIRLALAGHPMQMPFSSATLHERKRRTRIALQCATRVRRLNEAAA
jgi:hypothetical protein